MRFIYAVIARLFSGDRTLPSDIVAGRTGSARRYFSMTLGVVALGLAIAIAIQVGLWPIEQKLTTFAEAVVPEDFSLGITRGKLRINRPLPYTVHWPAVIQKELGDTRYPASLAVFVSDASVPNPGALSTYDALVVAAETTVYVHDAENGYRALPIEQDTELAQTTKSQILTELRDSLTHPFIRYRLYAPLFGLLVFAGIFFGLGIWYILTLAWYTTVLDLVNRTFHINPGIVWSQEYRLLVFFHMPLVGIITLFHTIFFHAVTGLIFTVFMVGWGVWAIRELHMNTKVVDIRSQPHTVLKKRLHSDKTSKSTRRK